MAKSEDKDEPHDESHGEDGKPDKSDPLREELQSQPELHEDSSPVMDRLNPDSALPVHLQEKSFDRDIWDRVKKHPLKNPILIKNQLDSDVETREILRQVMAAANEREKEVLLHNQTRVFREILGRVVDRVGEFLDGSLAPKTLIQKARTVESETIASTPAASTIGGSSSSVWHLRMLRLIIDVLTPKYFLLGLAVIFGCAAGYKQLQVHNLQEAVESYKLGASGIESTQAQMRQLLVDTQKDKDSWDAERTKLDGELARLRSEELSRVQELAVLKEIGKTIEAKLQTADQDLAAYRDKQTDEVKEKQMQLDAALERATKAETSLTDVSARFETLLKQVETHKKAEQKSQELVEAKAKEIEGVRESYSNLFYKNVSLGTDRTILRFAETAIYNIRTELNRYGSPDESRMQQFLREYDNAKKAIRSK